MFSLLIQIVVNGYKNVQFHIKGELSGHDKDYIQNVIETVAAILDCKEEDILLNGVQHSNSFLLSLSVKTVYIRKLLAINEPDRLRLIRLNIDYIIIDKETINLERPRGKQDNVFYIHFLQTYISHLESFTYLYLDRFLLCKVFFSII